MSIQKTVALTMAVAGFVPASEAVRALGLVHVGTIHRQISKGKLRAQRVGFYWFVSGASLLEAHAGTPMEAQVRQVLRENGLKA